MGYNFDKVAKVRKWEVKIDSAANYGSFEHDDFGEGGGLWFEVSDQSTQGDAGRKLVLIDYDGVYELPKDVIEAIRSLGYIVEDGRRMTLYEEVVALGIEHDHHESDLYLPSNQVTRDLIKKHGLVGSAFVSQIDKKVWIDAPFSYDPYWSKLCGK